MNSRVRKRNRINIELTSLLDVIFIILMVVLCHQQVNVNDSMSKSEEAEIAKEEAEEARAEAQASKELYDDRTDTYDNFSEHVSLISIYADYDVNNVRTRHLYVLKDNEEVFRIDITPENEDEVYDKFLAEFNSYIKEAEDSSKPVICSVNTDKILYRDKIRMDEIMENIESSNLYFKSTQE
ncbi:MAG: hypothetical protein K6B28_05405 [Lachnospiraceae bacterium]|nr:hypothetical protein [Lachnospiraceae bacterium]